MTPFDAFRASSAGTRDRPILSSDGAYDDVDPDRLPSEPDADG